MLREHIAVAHELRRLDDAPVGWQSVIDLHDCGNPLLGDIGWVRETMLQAASRAEATVIGEHFHQFEPHGISGVVIIGESHLAIHIWPERRFAAVDVFTCSAALKVRAACAYLVEAFRARRPNLTYLTRGSDRLKVMDHDAFSNHASVQTAPASTTQIKDMADAPCDELYIDEDTSAGGHWFVRRGTVASVQTRFQKAEIIELAEFGKALILDDEVQSIEADEYIYHEALVHPSMCLHACPRSVLIIGGGEGAVAREVLRHPTVRRVVMVDIDGEVVDLAREHLSSWHKGAFEDSRLELVIGDGYEYARNTGEKFDVIFVDVVSSFDSGPAQALYAKAFYLSAKQKLADDGIIVVQGTGCHVRDHGGHRLIRENLGGLFDHVSTYLTFVPSFLCMWGFVMASDGYEPRSASGDDIDRVLARRGLSGYLRFYDGRTHKGLFELPKDLRGLLGET